MNELQELAAEHIRPLLQLNDELFKLTQHEEKINVTTIVAVGDQSSGKTSVIEALSGVSLPRGEGIVTRVPLLIRLRDAGEGDESATLKPLNADPECGNPSDTVVQIEDFETVAEHVTRMTDELAGTSKDVVDKPLELTIFRREQVDLTVIDLPGMTRVAQEGQSKNIEETIAAMYNRYMKPDEAVLLNVVNATTDATASASLKMSREVDPNGERTLMCLTKIDLCQGDMAKKAVESATKLCSAAMVFPLRNRSQQESDDGISLQDVKEREKMLMEQLNLGDPEARGISGLTKRLVQLQAERIHATLPKVKVAVTKALEETKRRLDSFPPLPTSERGAWKELEERLRKATVQLRGEVRGEELEDDEETTIGLLDSFLSEETTVVLNPENKTIPSGTPERDFPSSTIDFEGAQLTFTMTEPEVDGSQTEFKELKVSCDTWPANLVIVGTAEYTNCDGSQQQKKLPFTLSSGGTIELCGWAQSLTISFHKSNGPTFENTPKLLCAELDALAHNSTTSFEQSIRGFHKRSFFFSAEFHQKLVNLCRTSRGGDGLPGTVSPSVQLKVLRALREPLLKVVQQYVDKVAEAVQSKSRARLQEAFAGLPYALTVVLDACDRYFVAQTELSHGRTIEVLSWEKDITTVNHYYMDIVAKTREELKEDKILLTLPGQSSRTPWSEVTDLSNETQALIDLQVKLWAYWKVILKRLTDNIIMAARYNLVRVPLLEKGLERAVEAAFDSEKAMDLASPGRRQEATIKDLKSRLERLEAASQKISKVSVSIPSICLF